MFGIASGHKRIFALTALITSMSYFRLLDDLRSFRMITLRRWWQAMPHSSILPRPVTYLNDGQERRLSLQLPRHPLVSHLGFEPQRGFHDRPGTRAGRLLYQFAREGAEDENSMSAPAGCYMQMAVYDLIGALYGPPEPMPGSVHTDKLFRRAGNIIKDRFADPDFGPCEAAAEAGISLRYLQKLFTRRGSTCGEFIYSLRLEHAARLLHRRKLLGTGQPVSEIAYACGFRDHTNFARKFRRRLGCSPTAHAGDHA
jgi:AraC family transcriptional activator of tynA and feaB